MSKILNTLSAIGALVMAATPLVAIGGIAHASEIGVSPAHVVVGDLNLGSTDGASAFGQRVDIAADSVCTARGDKELGARAACRDAVRQEAMERLSDAQRQDLRSAQAATRTTWTVAAR